MGRSGLIPLFPRQESTNTFLVVEFEVGILCADYSRNDLSVTDVAVLRLEVGERLALNRVVDRSGFDLDGSTRAVERLTHEVSERTESRIVDVVSVDTPGIGLEFTENMANGVEVEHLAAAVGGIGGGDDSYDSSFR